MRIFKIFPKCEKQRCVRYDLIQILHSPNNCVVDIEEGTMFQLRFAWIISLLYTLFLQSSCQKGELGHVGILGGIKKVKTSLQ